MQKIVYFADELASRFPKLERFLLIFSVAICWLNPFTGAIFGGITGIYIGMIEPKPEEDSIKLINEPDLQPAISGSSL